MAIAGLPDGVMDRILEVLQPEEVWLFGSRARETHSPDSDWDVMAVLPDSASDDRLDLGTLWPRLRDLRRLRVDVFPIRRRDFDQDRRIFGELAEAVAREGRSSMAVDDSPRSPLESDWTQPRSTRTQPRGSSRSQPTFSLQIISNRLPRRFLAQFDSIAG